MSLKGCEEVTQSGEANICFITVVREMSIKPEALFLAQQIGKVVKADNCLLKCKLKQVTCLCPSDWQTNRKTDNIWWGMTRLPPFRQEYELLHGFGHDVAAANKNFNVSAL